MEETRLSAAATRVREILDAAGIEYRLDRHSAVFTIDEMLASGLSRTDDIAKNIFLHDDKHRDYYLVVLRGEKRIDTKKLRRAIGSRPLSFADEEELNAVLGLTKGSVTPFGVLNDAEKCTHIYIDEDFKGSSIGVHPNDNTATVHLLCDELVCLLRENGAWAEYISTNFVPEAICKKSR